MVQIIFLLTLFLLRKPYSLICYFISCLFKIPNYNTQAKRKLQNSLHFFKTTIVISFLCGIFFLFYIFQKKVMISSHPQDEGMLSDRNEQDLFNNSDKNSDDDTVIMVRLVKRIWQKKKMKTKILIFLIRLLKNSKMNQMK